MTLVDEVRQHLKQFGISPRCWCERPDSERWLLLYFNGFIPSPNWFVTLFEGKVELLTHEYRSEIQARTDFERRAEQMLEC